jgi:DNA-binding HxlR family transcriptional regulator
VIPPHVEYSLTPLGESLVTRLLPLMEWLAEHAPAMVEGARPASAGPGV